MGRNDARFSRGGHARTHTFSGEKVCVRACKHTEFGGKSEGRSHGEETMEQKV